MTNLLNRLGMPFKQPAPTREQARHKKSWKFNGTLNGKPLTRSAIRRIGSRARAIELGVIEA